MDLGGLCFNQITGFDTKPDINQMTMREPKPYKCPNCIKSFANNSYLSQHMRIHLGIKPFGPCQFCGKKFTQLSHLQQHIRTHTGEKPYKCKIPGCEKAFSQLSNLQSHSRCHQSDKPYKCNSCYKCFNDETALLEHIPKHKESKHLKVHICPYCGKSYTQSLYLDKHMTKHADRRNDFSVDGFRKQYYPGDLSSDTLDSLHPFSQLHGLSRHFQMEASSINGTNGNINNASSTLSAGTSSITSPSAASAAVAAVTYPYSGGAGNGFSLSNIFQQQLNRNNVRNNQSVPGFNMITPLEKINSFNQNNAATGAANGTAGGGPSLATATAFVTNC